MAAAAGIAIEHVARSYIRKEEVVAKILAVRGQHPGLVHVISAMEACDAYQPWHDRQTHRTYLRSDTGKCLHYYLYFMDAELGLIYLRVPTWCPFRLQFYCNGHNWLASKLAAAGIGFTMADNAFIKIDDWPAAQALADGLSANDLHRILDLARQIGAPAAALAETVSALQRLGPARRGSGIRPRRRYLSVRAGRRRRPTEPPRRADPPCAVLCGAGGAGRSRYVGRHHEGRSNPRAPRRRHGPAGLHTCGNDMASIMDGAYPGPGITLGPALVFGWIAGRQAAGQIPDGR